MVKTIKVPPDGGYGWVIVLANALSSVIIIPLMQSFGIIFKDTFAEMGLSATEGSLIINLNAAFGMLLGMLNGVLLKVFGYRKIALTASCLICTGIFLTSYAKTFTHFMITYGLITSLGMGLNTSAYSLALNSYFRKKRSAAVGYAMTITGLGPIFMPQMIKILMDRYDVQGTTMILAGIAGNSFVSALLLQPVHWHTKNEIVDEDEVVDDRFEDSKDDKTQKVEAKFSFARSISQVETRRQNSMMDSKQSLDDMENVPIYGMDSALTGSIMTLHSRSFQRQVSIMSQTWTKASTLSLKEESESIYNSNLSTPIKKESQWKRFLENVVKFFDLDLLKDPVYVNILIGLSLAIFAEINFSLLTAFILAEFGLDNAQIATFLSILGIADIVFRFLAPAIGGFLKLSPRPMYLVTLVLLMLSRFSLLISNDYKILLGVALGLGIAKGVRTVYMSLVIPTYVPIEKLASASGLQMMVNGFCILLGGPIIGIIRDATGSYTLCIIALNSITFTTIVLWGIEAAVRRLRYKDETTVPPEQTNTLLDRS